jgi:D-inositol-3-phosphate glycosyltransferase
MERRLLHLSLLADPLSPFAGGTVGGRQVLVRDSVRAMQREGFGIDVMTAAEGRSSERFALGHLARVVRLPAAGTADPAEAVAAWRRAALEWIGAQDIAYSLLHSHHWLSGALARVLRGDLGIPWVHSPWSMPRLDDRASTDPDRGPLAEADLVVVPYPAFAERVVEVEPAARVRVVNPGVDPGTFFPRDAGPVLKALGQSQRVLLTVVGHQDEGLDALLGAWRQRAERGTLPQGASLVVAGVAAPEPGSEAWERAGVRFLGAITHRTLARYYAAAAVAVLPTRRPSLGMAALEAMASGTPVVASAVAGQSSVVVNQETGLLFDPADSEALLDGALDLYARPSLIRRMGAAAVDHVAAHYTLERMARELAAVYAEATPALLRSGAPA